MASSSSASKWSRRQRERIVGSSRPGAWLTRKKSVFDGGSSSIFSSAFGAGCSSSSTAVDHRDPPRRQRRGHAHELAELADLLDADVARELVRLLVRQPLQPAHVGMASGLDELDDRMLVGGFHAGQVDRRPGGVGKHAPGRGVGEARFPHALAGRRAARHGGACGSPRQPRTARRPCPGRRSRQEVLRCASSRRCGDFVRRARSVDQLDPLGLLGGDDPEGGVDLAVIVVRAAADAVALAVVARAGPLAAFVESEDQRAVGKQSSIPKALISRTVSIPRPPAPP